MFSAAMGLGGLIDTAPALWDGVRLVAGGALIYMGARGVSAAVRGRSLPENQSMVDAAGSPFLLGLMTNLANPKAAVVLVGLTAVLGDAMPDRSSLILAVLGMPVLAAGWFVLLSTVLSHERVRAVLESNQRLLDMSIGIALAGVGAILIQTAQPL